jgi:hypothetical protein
VIEGREEFKDVDLVFPWRVPHLIMRSDHHTVRPFYVKFNDEEIRVTVKNIDKHFQRGYPYYMTLQRYIVGRPNLLCLPIYPAQEDKSLHWQAGASMNYLIKSVNVWCFNDTYPGRIDVDCSSLTPSNPIKLGDVEKMLPYGMMLHKMHHSQRFHSVVKLDTTNLYNQRKNLLSEQAEAIKEQRRKMQTSLIAEKKRDSEGKKKAEKHVPAQV